MEEKDMAAHKEAGRAQKAATQEAAMPAATSPEAGLDGKVVLSHETDALIRKRVYAAVALGLIPVPLVDLVGLTALQVELVRALSKQYDVPFSTNKARNVIASLLGGIAPIAVAPLALSAAKAIPVVGWSLAGAGLPILFGAGTYAVGHVIARCFEGGETLVSIDTGKLKDFVKTSYAEGREYASVLVKKARGRSREELKAAVDEAMPESGQPS